MTWRRTFWLPTCRLHRFITSTIHILRGHRDLETDEMMAVVMMIDSLGSNFFLFELLAYL